MLAFKLYTSMESGASSIGCYKILHILYIYNNCTTKACLQAVYYLVGDAKYLISLLNMTVYSDNSSKNVDISLCHINIRSLKVKIGNIFVKMELMRHEIASNFIIIIVSESWHSENDNFNDFLTDDFQGPSMLNINGHGGGLICWIANYLMVKHVHEFEIYDLEAIWLEIRSSFFFVVHIDPHHSPLIIGKNFNQVII